MYLSDRLGIQVVYFGGELSEKSRAERWCAACTCPAIILCLVCTGFTREIRADLLQSITLADYVDLMLRAEKVMSI